MFELSRLIARESASFTKPGPSPDKSEARKAVFSQPHREKLRNRVFLKIGLSFVTFFGEAKKVTRRLAKRVGDANAS
jgi:hypothetical protein